MLRQPVLPNAIQQPEPERRGVHKAPAAAADDEGGEITKHQIAPHEDMGARIDDAEHGREEQEQYKE